MSQVVVREYEEDHLPELVADNADTEVNIETEAQIEVDDKKSEDPAADNQEEIYYHYTVDTKDPDPWLKVHKYKVLSFIFLVTFALTTNYLYKEHKKNLLTVSYVEKPKIGDIYFLDFRLMQENLRPTEKYRIAKLTDITGDIITLNYSSYFYPKKHELNETIRFAQLRFEKFFQVKRNNFTIPQLNAMVELGAILQVRRPDGNMLDGNLVVPDKQFETNKVFIPGNKENLAGVEFLKFEYSYALAFEKFKASAALGFAKGQVNLAQMYLTGKGVDKNVQLALHWLKQGSLQANESAIIKYGIVCERIASCYMDIFYQELLDAGVNIEFSNVKAK